MPFIPWVYWSLWCSHCSNWVLRLATLRYETVFDCTYVLCLIIITSLRILSNYDLRLTCRYSNLGVKALVCVVYLNTLILAFYIIQVNLNKIVSLSRLRRLHTFVCQVRTVIIDYKWFQLLRFIYLIDCALLDWILLSQFLNFSLHFHLVLFLLINLFSIVYNFKVAFSFSTINTLQLIVAISVVVASTSSTLLHLWFLDLTDYINTACYMSRWHNVGFILLLSFFIHKVVRRRYVIMTIRFDTFDCVISIESELLQNLLIYCVVEWHKLLLGEETLWCFIFELFEPRMGPYFLNSVALAGVDL